MFRVGDWVQQSWRSAATIGESCIGIPARRVVPLRLLHRQSLRRGDLVFVEWSDALLLLKVSWPPEGNRLVTGYRRKLKCEE